LTDVGSGPGSTGEADDGRESDGEHRPPESEQAQSELVATGPVVQPSAEELAQILAADGPYRGRTRSRWKGVPAVLTFLVVVAGAMLLVDQSFRDATIGRGLELILG
jgi:hypothetical protein